MQKTSGRLSEHVTLKPVAVYQRMHYSRAMKEYEIISMELSLGKYWVITYFQANGEHEKETIEAYDSNEAFIKFRNLMIERSKKKLQTPKR